MGDLQSPPEQGAVKGSVMVRQKSLSTFRLPAGSGKVHLRAGEAML